MEPKYSEQIGVNVGWYEAEIKRLEAELKHCQKSEGWSKMMAMEGKIESLEAECKDALNYMVTLSDTITRQAAEVARLTALLHELEKYKKQIKLYHEGIDVVKTYENKLGTCKSAVKALKLRIECMKAKSHKWLPEYLQAKKEVADLKEEVNHLTDDLRFCTKVLDENKQLKERVKNSLDIV